MMPAVWLALRLLGFSRALGFSEIKVTASQRKHDLSNMDFAQRCAELTAIASRNGLYRANCLHQSLALCRVLRGHGLAAKLRIGVLPRSSPFQAHAWVELDGVPLGQQSVAEYEVFERLTGNPKNMRFV